MYSSKPNAVIRFYTQPKSSWKLNNPQSVAKLLLQDSQYANKYPDFIVQHQKFIIQDYKKKTEEIKSLKQRFPYTQRALGINQNKSCICQRASLSPKRRQRKFNKISTQLSMHQKQQPIRQSCVNTINLQCFVDRPPSVQKNQRFSKGLSQFQKNTIKRMKTREDMILKKKCDSLAHETQRNLVVVPQNMSLSSITPKDRPQKHFFLQ